jgi:hypothetical protein
MDPIVERYVLLGLRLGRHVDGLVDAYYGPGELRAQADAGEPVDAAALAEDAAGIAADLAAGGLEDERRTRWLAGQVEGLRTTARRLAGADVSYVEETRRCYGITPRLVPDEELAAAHERLAEAIPGRGPLGDRYRAWRDDSTVPVEALEAIFDALTADFRRRTAERFGLPAGEGAAIELVRDEPWLAFNYYLGDLRSRVAMNVDLPVRALDVPELVAHEIYPGHHTEQVTKEVGLVRGRGHDEETIFLVNTPQCLIAEGIASHALAALGPGALEVTADVLGAHGVPYDPALAVVVGDVARTIGCAADNAAYMVHEEGRDVEEARAHVARWSLRPPGEVEKTLEFVLHPTWRAYVNTYRRGEVLVERYVDGDPARFRHLLAEQVTPDEIGAT